MAVIEVTIKPDVHKEPAWRERGSFVLPVKLSLGEDETLQRVEQLWSRQVADNRFEICCIPFFAYDLALGDEVETGRQGTYRYVVQRVVKRSGNYTRRVWFGN